MHNMQRKDRSLMLMLSGVSGKNQAEISRKTDSKPDSKDQTNYGEDDEEL
jgi:hypothetical protein